MVQWASKEQVKVEGYAGVFQVFFYHFYCHHSRSTVELGWLQLVLDGSWEPLSGKTGKVCPGSKGINL